MCHLQLRHSHNYPFENSKGIEFLQGNGQGKNLKVVIWAMHKAGLIGQAKWFFAQRLEYIELSSPQMHWMAHGLQCMLLTLAIPLVDIQGHRVNPMVQEVLQITFGGFYNSMFKVQ